MVYLTRKELQSRLQKIFGPSKEIEILEFSKSRRLCVLVNGDMLDKWTFNKKTGLDYDSIRIKNNNLVLWGELGNEICNKKSTVK